MVQRWHQTIGSPLIVDRQVCEGNQKAIEEYRDRKRTPGSSSMLPAVAPPCTPQQRGSSSSSRRGTPSMGEGSPAGTVFTFPVTKTTERDRAGWLRTHFPLKDHNDELQKWNSTIKAHMVADFVEVLHGRQPSGKPEWAEALKRINNRHPRLDTEVKKVKEHW